jgi:two-component system chemotaxis sensor kinase CheA
MDPSQYAELFLAESREHLGAINQQLLEWEREPTASEPVSGVFRAVHTIKGMAATMGYQAVTDLAHRMEDLLDILRSGKQPPSDELFELLFQAADQLDQVVEASVAGRKGELDSSEVLGALDRTVRALTPAQPRARRVAPSEPEQARGAGTLVRVVIDRDATLKGARVMVVLSRARRLGEVSAVRPPSATIESEDFDGKFEFRLDAKVDNTEIEAEIEAAGDVEQVVVGGAEDATGVAELLDGRTKHIRVDLRRVDTMMNLVGELVTVKDRLASVSAKRGDPELEDVSLKVSYLTSQLQSEIIEARMTPVWQVFDRFPRLVRDAARQLGKTIDFWVEGKEIELDRSILDEIGDPLVHMLRNAVDHGIEPPGDREAAGKPKAGRIVLSAIREKATVAIHVSDDGRGIDRTRVLQAAKERGLVGSEVDALNDEVLLRLLARPGFSTAVEVSDVSGRGVGIDVVATRLRSLGGGLTVRSVSGEGTTFTLRLPTTLAIVRALTTQVGAEHYLLPVTHVAETVDLEPAAVTRLQGEDAMLFRGDMIPLVDLREIMGIPGQGPARKPVVVVQIGERRSGLVVDALTGQQEIVVKSFDSPTGALPIFSGATILGDGTPALILDAGGLV